jgi:hypothetical protein
MPRQPMEFYCLLISPSDVFAERAALTELVNLWNAQIGRALNARLELVRWESHATPDLSGDPQSVINTQLVDECDLGIAVFWARLGTPTELYPSGSVEEIYKLIQRGARVMVYFSNRPVPHELLRDDQYARLRELRGKLQREGLVATYFDIADLREQVNLHLTNVITQLLVRAREDVVKITIENMLVDSHDSGIRIALYELQGPMRRFSLEANLRALWQLDKEGVIKLDDPVTDPCEMKLPVAFEYIGRSKDQI